MQCPLGAPLWRPAASNYFATCCPASRPGLWLCGADRLAWQALCPLLSISWFRLRATLSRVAQHSPTLSADAAAAANQRVSFVLVALFAALSLLRLPSCACKGERERERYLHCLAASLFACQSESERASESQGESLDRLQASGRISFAARPGGASFSAKGSPGAKQ